MNQQQPSWLDSDLPTAQERVADFLQDGVDVLRDIRTSVAEGAALAERAAQAREEALSSHWRATRDLSRSMDVIKWLLGGILLVLAGIWWRLP